MSSIHRSTALAFALAAAAPTLAHAGNGVFGSTQMNAAKPGSRVAPVAATVTPYHWAAIGMDARTRAYEESKVGYGDTVGGPFSRRNEWQDLRPAATRAAKANAKLFTPPKARTFRRTPLRWQPTVRVGGLGRQLEVGAPAPQPRSLQSLRYNGAERAPQLDRLYTPKAGAQGTPAFNRLSESAESFSLGFSP